jgi:hypothetical protein
MAEQPEKALNRQQLAYSLKPKATSACPAILLQAARRGRGLTANVSGRAWQRPYIYPASEPGKPEIVTDCLR